MTITGSQTAGEADDLGIGSVTAREDSLEELRKSGMHGWIATSISYCNAT
jgi:hypothetical protein